MQDAHTAGIDARGLVWEAKEALREASDWKDYVRGVYSIDPGDFPFVTYVGVNFTATGIKNFKFYFSFFRRLDESELRRVLPVEDRSRFDELYAQWTPSPTYDRIHRGVSFALKVDAHGALTHYYHLRLPGMPVGPPARLALAPADEAEWHGVCEEFRDGTAHLKRYFYGIDKATIAHSLREANLQSCLHTLPWIERLEYIESETRDKLTWISGHPDLVGTLIENQGPPRLGSALAKMCRDGGFDLFGPGSARDGGDHSLYFIDTRGPVHPGGYIFDGVRTFNRACLELEDSVIAG